MGRSAPRSCNLTVDQLTAERPKRASVGSAMRYLSKCSAEERVEALARVDTAFAEMKVAPVAYIGPGVPQLRSKLYLKKNLVPVVFVMLEDHREDRGTIRGSTDGSLRRAFSFRATGLVIEERADSLILAGIPRRTRSWINERFKPARLGWLGTPDLDGEWTDEQRAAWARLGETANLTERIIDKARTQPAPKHYGNGRVYNPW